jgi:DNA-binding ferritin-like protein
MEEDYMTTVVFEQFFDVHTKSLRGEFRRIDDKIDAVGERMDERFEQVDERFERVGKRFDALEYRMDERFEQVNERFEQVNERFDALEYKISQNEARARNYRLSRLHQKIQKINVLDSTSSIHGTIKEPVYFPATIKEFWNLRKKRKCGGLQPHALILTS